MTKVCELRDGPLIDTVSFRLNPGGDQNTRSLAHEPEPSSTSSGTTHRAEMGVSFQPAGCVKSAEECGNENPGIDVDRSPHPATQIKETPARGVTGADYLSSETT